MLRRFAYALIVLIAIPLQSAFGQSNAVDGAVSGYIHDPSGQAVHGAQVTLLNLGTNISIQAITDDQGYYRFPLVQVGTYQLTVTAPGFDTYVRKGIALNVGQMARVDATIKIGSVSQTVTVTAPGAMVETGNAVVGSVLAELPQFAR